MIWANSGDAHVLEPDALWVERMPRNLAEVTPRTEQIDERTEVVHVDGQSFERRKQLNSELTREDLDSAGLVARVGRLGCVRSTCSVRPARGTSNSGWRTWTRGDLE